MELKLKDFQSSHAQAKFFADDTVTIQIYDKDRNDITPASPDDECVPFAVGSNLFQWPYSNLGNTPATFQEYTWTMTNQDGLEQTDVDVFSSDPETIFMIPFDVDIEKIDINKGDSWEPVFRVDTTSENLKIGIELADMKTPDYDQTIINKYTANITGGGDDQVKLVAQGDTFQFFRVFLSGDETILFGSRYIDMKITIETAGGQISTVKKKIPFTQTSAITFDSV
jgi:hypothetical protein